MDSGQINYSAKRGFLFESKAEDFFGPRSVRAVREQPKKSDNAAIGPKDRLVGGYVLGET